MRTEYAPLSLHATKPSPLAEWFRHFEVVMRHPDLRRDEQFLWLWLATHCVNQSHHACSFSYKEISQAVNMSLKAVHGALFRLKIMGFLKAELPVWYGEINGLMGGEIRELVPVRVEEEELERMRRIKRKMEEDGVVSGRYGRKEVLLNLLEKRDQINCI